MTSTGRALPRVLSIAGTDPTGGAGLQADLKAIAAHDGYGMGVVTALVAQNTHGVRLVHVPDVEFLREQLDAVSDDVVVDAIKIGMLANAAVVRTVTAWLREHRPPIVVIDPVMVATNGDRLLDEEATAAMTELFALADLITPNRAELAELAELAGAPERSGVNAALTLACVFDVLVLAKGGHDQGDTSDDELVSPSGAIRTFSAPRVSTSNTHGTGCSLSSAIATLAARDGDWELGVGGAKTWLTRAIRGADALNVGTGKGPIDHGAVIRAALPRPTWTSMWWDDAADVLKETLEGDFLVGLSNGSLDPVVFAGYLAQDLHYLRAYQQYLAQLSTWSTGDAAAFWSSSAAEGCAVEARNLHLRRLAETHAGDPVHATCADYLSHLQAAADTGSVAILAAAALPCFRVYAWTGTQIGAVPDHHPYADWVTAYNDPEFATVAAEATREVEQLAASATPAVRGRMARAHRLSVRPRTELLCHALSPPTPGA